MAYEWRCKDCGQAWTEEGRGRYVLTAGQHMKRQNHEPLGLMDTETGEILVPNSINRNAAEKLGIIERPDRSRKSAKKETADAPSTPLDAEPEDRPTRPMAQAQTVGGNDPAMSGAVKAVRQTVEGMDTKNQVVGFEAQWPVWALGYFDTLRADFLDDNDQPYPWSTKDFMRFVLDVYRIGCRQLLTKVIERRFHEVEATQRAAMATAMVSTIEKMPADQFLAAMAREVEQDDPTWAALLRNQAEQRGA